MAEAHSRITERGDGALLKILFFLLLWFSFSFSFSFFLCRERPDTVSRGYHRPPFARSRTGHLSEPREPLAAMP